MRRIMNPSEAEAEISQDNEVNNMATGAQVT